MTEELQAELDFLRWFVGSIQLGPDNYEEQVIMRTRYERETGKKVPDEWRYE